MTKDNNGTSGKKAAHKKKRHNGAKPKMTKEERRAKYTQIARDRRDRNFERERQRGLTCFHCRKRGHAASNCPDSGRTNAKVCYKCGSTEHSLYKCDLYNKNDTNQELPFAECFVCGGKGHLASTCSQNERGIYVNGGACRECGSNQHRALNCPEKKKVKPVNDGIDDSVKVDDLLEEETGAKLSDSKKTDKKKKKQRVVKF